MNPPRSSSNGFCSSVVRAFDYTLGRTGLTERMRPIVESATASTGVTSAYKDMLGAAGGFAGMMPASATDIDGYITSKTLDGLFLMIAKEERKIRKNPMARSTELLQKVFSAY